MYRKSAFRQICAVIVTIVVLTLQTGSSEAGSLRKGILIGIGGGYAPISNQSFQSYSRRLFVGVDPYDSLNTYYSEYYVSSSHSVSDGGPAFQVDFGYAWNEHNALFIREQQVVYSTDPALSTGITALCWSHYLGATGHSYFYILGLAISTSFSYNAGTLTSDRRNSPGVVLGFGYEFGPHFSLEVNYSQVPTYRVSQGSQLTVMFTSTAY